MATNPAPQVQPWGSNGVTVNRRFLEQNVVVPSWSNSQIKIPFQALQPYGYLRKLFLWSPLTSYAGGIVTGPVPNALLQMGPFRSIARFQLSTQGASNLYDVTGEDLAVLNYHRNGRLRNNPNTTINSGIVGAPGNALPPYGSLIGGASAINYGPYVANSGTTAIYGMYLPIPITEILKVKNVVTAQGNMASDMEVEMGMLTLQNIQQNVTPNFFLNPVYSQDYNAPFKSAGTGSVNLTNVQWNLSRESYDALNDPRQQPPSFLQSYIISRTSNDVPVTGGKVTYNIANAGMLMRLFYLFYIDGGTLGTNYNWVDIGNGNNNNAQVQFGFGSIVNKIQETVSENLARTASDLGIAPLCLVHDFMRDNSEVQMPNTVNQTNIRTTITGLDTTGTGPTRMHVIEERLIPVSTQ